MSPAGWRYYSKKDILAQVEKDYRMYFVPCYIDKRSRTHDQMVQAARSGVQNIAEGSQASATSKKTELKLTNVARASLEELRLDYEDFLRQRELPMWEPDHPALKRFKAKRCVSLEDVRAWVEEEYTKGTLTNRDEQGLTRKEETRARRPSWSVVVRVSPCQILRWWPMPRFRF